MNNKNKILVGCLALLLVLSVGYALFSETITINGTATAKGSFGVTATCSAGYNTSLVNAGMYESSNFGQTGYISDSCTVVNDVVSYTTGLNYPGAKRVFTVKITNTGTINAEIDMPKTGGDGPFIEKNRSVCALDENGTPTEECTQNLKYNNGTGIVYKDLAYLRYVAFETNDTICIMGDYCSENYIADNGNATLKPGESIYYIVGFEWPSDYVSGYDNGFKASASFEIPFVQETAN